LPSGRDRATKLSRNTHSQTLGAVGLLFAALIACISAMASAVAADRHPNVVGAKRAGLRAGAAPRISLSVPTEVTREAEAIARGRVRPALRGVGVVLEARRKHQWRRLTRGRIRHGAFRLPFVLRTRVGRTRVRAVLVRGGRRVAISNRRLILVQKPNRRPATTNGAYWGAWIGPQLTGVAAPFDMTAVSELGRMTGKPLSVLEFSSPFADCSTSPCSYYGFPTGYFEDIRAYGAIPFLSWSSAMLPGGAEQPEFQLSDLIGGAYDEYIRSFASAAKAWGHPFFLRFDWEMNGNWFPWGEGVNGNQPGEFAAAWRHVHDIFTAVGANNATWVWCPYVNFATHLQDLYPGDPYVDWTCLDGYNWGTNPALPRTFRSFSDLFGSAYEKVTETIAPTKPMLIGETASSEYGGSKATWIEEMFSSLATEYPLIRGLLWFEQSGNGMDWPLESSESALASFATGIQESRWVGNSYGDLDTSPIPPP
jgi:hypothetical protein